MNKFVTIIQYAFALAIIIAGTYYNNTPLALAGIIILITDIAWNNDRHKLRIYKSTMSSISNNLPDINDINTEIKTALDEYPNLSDTDNKYATFGFKLGCRFMTKNIIKAMIRNRLTK